MTDQEHNMKTDLRARVVQLEKSEADKHHRLTDLERWRQEVSIAAAQQSAEWKGMIERFNERFNNLENQIGKIAGTLTFLSRTFIGAVILAFVAFLISGGMRVP